MFSKLNSISSIGQSKRNESPFARRYIDISDGKYGKITKIPSALSNSNSRNRLASGSTHCKSLSSIQIEPGLEKQAKSKLIPAKRMNMDLPPRTILKPPKPKIIQKVEKYFENKKESNSKKEINKTIDENFHRDNQEQRVKDIMNEVEQAVDEISQDNNKPKSKKKKRKNLAKFLINQDPNKSEMDEQINIQIKSEEQTIFKSKNSASKSNIKNQKAVEANQKDVPKQSHKQINQNSKRSLKLQSEEQIDKQSKEVSKKHKIELIKDEEPEKSSIVHKRKKSRNRHRRQHYISESYTEQLFNRLHSSKSIGMLLPDDILLKHFQQPNKRLKRSKHSVDRLGILDKDDMKLLNLCMYKKRAHSRSYSNLKRRKLKQNRKLSEVQSQERKELLQSKYEQHKEKMKVQSNTKLITLIILFNK